MIKDPYRPLAGRVRSSIDKELLSGLAADPAVVAPAFGVKVLAWEVVAAGDPCSCDGIYVSEGVTTPVIGYRPTPNSRRENFTVLHELGHHLIRQDDAMLSLLADMGEDGGREAEERVCHAFAAATLVPDDLVTDVLGGSRPGPNHIVDLFHRSTASREVCAIRIAEHIPGMGYAVLADRHTTSIRFAAPSPTCPYVWRRGSVLSRTHPFWKTEPGTGARRCEAAIEWPSGNKLKLWAETIADDRIAYAVMTDDPYIAPESGLTLVGTATTMARPVAMSGSCRHCGADTWGYRACDECGDVHCKHCGRCGCGAREAAELTCSRCYELKAAHLFPTGGGVCVDCL